MGFEALRDWGLEVSGFGFRVLGLRVWGLRVRGLEFFSGLGFRGQWHFLRGGGMQGPCCLLLDQAPWHLRDKHLNTNSSKDPKP